MTGGGACMDEIRGPKKMPAETSGHAKEQNTTRIGESASQAQDNDPLLSGKRCFAHICAPSMGNTQIYADLCMPPA